MSNPPTNDLFLRACRRAAENGMERTPIWVMRQAGRYLPAYRAIREQVDFKTLYKTPELAAEVTVQPIDLLGFDAAIIFSDILVVPEAMGMALEFSEQQGPAFAQPLRCASAIECLRRPEVEKDLPFVMQALRLARERLQNRVPLIGFCGSPWTLATYMVEGRISKNFLHIKSLMYQEPQALHSLLDRLTVALTDYLNAQIRAGAQAVQIFDSWGDVLAPDDYEEFSLRYVRRLIAGIEHHGAPVIFFLRGHGCGLEKLSACGAEVLGIDWTIDLAEARQRVGDRVALQGNLDPGVLFATPEVVRAETKKILDKFGGGPGHIFNLGHGILPQTPLDNVRAMIAAVREFSSQQGLPKTTLL